MGEEISRIAEYPLAVGLNSENKLYANLFWQFGPLILLKKDERLKVLLNDAIGHKQRIIQELKRTAKETAKIQADWLRQEIQLMEVMLKWLFQ